MLEMLSRARKLIEEHFYPYWEVWRTSNTASDHCVVSMAPESDDSALWHLNLVRVESVKLSIGERSTKDRLSICERLNLQDVQSPCHQIRTLPRRFPHHWSDNIRRRYAQTVSTSLLAQLSSKVQPYITEPTS
jgi:hypothetical protein